jgi:hypothetical protein
LTGDLHERFEAREGYVRLAYRFRPFKMPN